MRILALLLMLALPVRAHDFDLCQTFAAYSTGSDAIWDAAGYTFEDMPTDLQMVDMLWIDDPYSSGANYTLFFSPSKLELLVFAFRSLTISADSAGNHRGAHDFCYPVKVYELNTGHE